MSNDDTTDVMLTTTDNPYNPFTQWNEWLAYDMAAGHYTLAYLGRIVRSSHDLSQADELKAIDDAIDEIIKLNINGLYSKVSNNSINKT